MAGESTRAPIGRRGVGSEPQVAKYGKRSRVSAGTGVHVCESPSSSTTVGYSLKKPKDFFFYHGSFGDILCKRCIFNYLPTPVCKINYKQALCKKKTNKQKRYKFIHFFLT